MAAVLVLLASAATAEEMKKDKFIPWRDGLWRTELSAFSGIRSGRRSRTGDINVSGSLEYDIPTGKRSTNSIRLHPLFLYEEDRTDKSIWGVAFGHTVRIYKKNFDRRGMFVEMGGSVLWHSARIRGNSSKTNFILEPGIGYKFQTDWHIAAKVRHISNSGIDSSNSGANALGFAFGHTF